MISRDVAEPANVRGPLPPDIHVKPFPASGELLGVVQAEWDAAAEIDQHLELDLPRPWDPATVTSPELRQELWVWLDAVADWINAEQLWDPGALIPACWAYHPHLVHEMAVTAEARRRAGLSAAANPLEEWQRIVLPAFLDRTHLRIRQHCDDQHYDAPARAARDRYRGVPPSS